MKTRCCFVFLLWALSISASAGLIYESDIARARSCGGPSLSTRAFVGNVFTLEAPHVLTGIGGEICASRTDMALFGAVLPFPEAGIFPSFLPSEIGSNALAHALFTASVENRPEDLLMPLDILLPAGNYALLFGAGFFGATGGGIMADAQIDIPGIFFRGDLEPGIDRDRWIGVQGDGLRFVVTGTPVGIPNPATLPLFLSALAALGLVGWHRRRA